MGPAPVKLVDSTVLVDVTRRLPEAIAWVERQEQRLFVSEVTRAEVLRGMRSHERSGVASSFAALSWLPVDEAVSTRAGALGRTHRASHHLGVADLLIAATALEHGLELVTSNVKHYPMFDGLVAPY